MISFHKEELERLQELWQESIESGDESKANEHMNNYTNNQNIIQLWEGKQNEQ